MHFGKENSEWMQVGENIFYHFRLTLSLTGPKW